MAHVIDYRDTIARDVSEVRLDGEVVPHVRWVDFDRGLVGAFATDGNGNVALCGECGQMKTVTLKGTPEVITTSGVRLTRETADPWR